jgi:hypothetical protein
MSIIFILLFIALAAAVTVLWNNKDNSEPVETDAPPADELITPPVTGVALPLDPPPAIIKVVVEDVNPSETPVDPKRKPRKRYYGKRNYKGKKPNGNVKPSTGSKKLKAKIKKA